MKNLVIVALGLLPLSSALFAQSPAFQQVVVSETSGNKMFLDLNLPNLQQSVDNLYARVDSALARASSQTWEDVLLNGASPGMDIDFSSFDLTGLGGLVSSGTLAADSLTLGKDAVISGALNVDGATTLNATTVDGDLDLNGNADVSGTLSVVGMISGQVDDISNHSTDVLSEGGTNLYFTDARAVAALSATVASLQAQIAAIGTSSGTSGGTGGGADLGSSTPPDGPPTMVIGALEVTDGGMSPDTALSLTFNSSKFTADFAAEDISVLNGTIAGFAGAGVSYTATFTPDGDGACAINVAEGAFTDAVDGLNNAAADQFFWTYVDMTPPRISIASSEVLDGESSYDAALFLTFSSSEMTTDFNSDDVSVTNGSISDFAGSGKTYTAVFTPAGEGECTIDVAEGSFADEVGNGNLAASQFNWTYDITPPTVSITASEVNVGGSSSDLSISLSFTCSEETADFAAEDIVVTNGVLSAFAGSASAYSATFTPSGDGACTINVGEGSFTDAAGNSNSAAGEFNWTYVDNVPPTMSIVAAEVSDGDGSGDPTLSLTFTSSESTSDFSAADIAVTNGSISDFSGTDMIYTATFTPTADGACTINVPAGAFTDAVGNSNAAAEEFNWTYSSSPCGTETTLTYLGHDYSLVNIGEQCWFAQNLQADLYANGDVIDVPQTSAEWEFATEGATAFYLGNSALGPVHGRLYNWWAAFDSRGLCPSGWHVPTKSEVSTLATGYGGIFSAGLSLKSFTWWDGTNASGFDARGSGFRATNGNYYDMGSTFTFWIVDGTNTTFVKLISGDDGLSWPSETFGKTRGRSVRCIKD